MPASMLWGYYPTTGVWKPIVVNTDGKLVIDPSEVTLDKLGDVEVPTPADGDFVYWDAATGLWKPKAHAALTTGVHGVGASYLAKTSRSDQLPKLHDADVDTKVDVEESADEDKIRMDVKGVEAFLLDDAGILTLAKQSRCRAYLGTAAQTIATNTTTKVTLNTEDFDENGEFDSTTNYRFTATKAGYYFIVGQVAYELPADAAWYQVAIMKNGIRVCMYIGHASHVGWIVLNAADLEYLAIGDYLELYTFHTTGASRDIYIGHDMTFMAIHKLS